jgi:hypothetical protein
MGLKERSRKIPNIMENYEGPFPGDWTVEKKEDRVC